MTEEPARNPEIMRALLQAFLSTTPVREGMLSLHTRVQALHAELIRLGQEQGEIRKDLPAEEIAYAFRQTIFGTVLIWSLYGDATLRDRIESAFNLLWTGMAPRGDVTIPPAGRSSISGD